MSAGSNVESRSRGISNGQSPAGVITVFALLPLRWLPVFPCALCSARGWFSWAKRTQHVHFKTRTVWQADPEEKPRGFADRSPFDSDKLPPRRHAPPPD